MMIICTNHSFLTTSNTVAAVVVFLLLCSIVITESSVGCKGPRTTSDLIEKLWGPNSGYDKLTRPSAAMAAANSMLNPAYAQREQVQFQLHVLSIKAFDDLRSEFQFMVWSRVRWNDYRLKYANASSGGCFSDTRVGFHEKYFDNIWKPDVLLANLVDEEEIAGRFYIYPSGDVLYWKSSLISISCQIDFTKFPRDEQKCQIIIGTGTEDAEQVQLSFYLPAVSIADSSSVGYGGSTDWDIVSFDTEDANRLNGELNIRQEQSILFVVFKLKRNSGHYLSFVVGPTMIIVIIGWASFFIDRKAAPARVTLSMVCFLTNMNFLSNQIRSMPRLNNDVWLLRFLTMSMVFTFYSVIEYVICNYLCRVQERLNKGRNLVREAKTKPFFPGEDSEKAPDESSLCSRRGFQDTKNNKNVMDSLRDGCSLDVDNVQVTKADLLAHGYSYKIDILLLKKDGTLIIMDEHVDIFSRYMYPIAYTIAFSVFWFL